MVIIEKENFSVSQICSSGQCFRLDPADETGKVYELTAGDRYLKIEVAEDQKKVRFYCTQEEFEQFWKTYFDLDTCYADYLSLIKDDEYLKRAAGFGSGIRILQQDLWEIIYVFLTIFLYLPKCPQSLILSALRAFCFCGKPRISRSIFLYFPCQSWLKSW